MSHTPDLDPGTRHDERGHGGDVDRVGEVTAGAHHVE